MRYYHVITGSKAFFDSKLPDPMVCDAQYFLELVRLSDERKQRGISFSDDDKAKILILKNDNYHGIVESAHDRLSAILEEITTEDAEIYIHNPPATLRCNLDRLTERKIIEQSHDENEEYPIYRDSVSFANNMHQIEQHLIGQEDAVHGISKSMWYLTRTNRKKPYVIMLYGGSSLGKTELVREIAKYFFDDKFMEKHLSMFKNEKYSDYFFGQNPNRRSLGFDLLERDSNLIFLDELDKCPDYFYSAFYTMFDNTIFQDAVYDVNISGALIILTSNYATLDEMKEKLGLPIFFRIDKFLYFSMFSAQSIYQITMNEIKSRSEDYKDQYSADDVYEAVCQKIQSSEENARTIKNKVQDVVEDMLFEEVMKKY